MRPGIDLRVKLLEFHDVSARFIARWRGKRGSVLRIKWTVRTKTYYVGIYLLRLIKKKKIQMPIKKIEKPIKETGTKINVTRVLKGLKPGKYTNCGHNKKL